MELSRIARTQEIGSKLLKALLPPINRAGWPFILVFAVITAGLFAAWQPAGWVGVLLTLWCIYFFRDPSRVIPRRSGLMVSPADGLIQQISLVIPPAEVGLGAQPLNRISIFMNVFDIHVNRIPIAGRISLLAYRPGKYFNASLDKASKFNECQCIRLSTNEGLLIGIVQIAGLIARRIKCDLMEDQIVETGERFGLIRFGSRVDVYLPSHASTLVIEGQRVIGGESILADFETEEKPRSGEIC